MSSEEFPAAWTKEDDAKHQTRYKALEQRMAQLPAHTRAHEPAPFALVSWALHLFVTPPMLPMRFRDALDLLAHAEHVRRHYRTQLRDALDQDADIRRRDAHDPDALSRAERRVLLELDTLHADQADGADVRGAYFGAIATLCQMHFLHAYAQSDLAAADALAECFPQAAQRTGADARASALFFRHLDADVPPSRRQGREDEQLGDAFAACRAFIAHAVRTEPAAPGGGAQARRRAVVEGLPRDVLPARLAGAELADTVHAYLAQTAALVRALEALRDGGDLAL